MTHQELIYKNYPLLFSAHYGIMVATQISKDKQMTYKIAICDDSAKDTQYVADIVNRWGYENSAALSIKRFSSAEAFLFNYEDEKDFDILLLDIEMNRINGIDLAKQIRAVDSTVQIIFITGYPDFISEGYDVSALHYLMKPVKEDKLFSVLNRATQNINKADVHILIQSGGEQIKLSVKKIKYVEAASHMLRICAEDKVYETRMTIAEAEKNLSDGFIRCHRSYLVNIRHISQISKTDVILDGGEMVPLARSAYKDVNQAFIKYYTESQNEVI